MADVIFFEKPGCINNTRQKQLLEQAGHTVTALNLLTEDWASKPEELRAFFAGKPVAEWFNRSAPAIKQGSVNPDSLDAEQAIEAMVADPLLIRRPLMQVGAEKTAGFDETFVNDWIGLKQRNSKDDLETCPHTLR
ncbi:MAG: ArsC/Spx/MgsR family protein [Gammaproteobacteria bacterium]